MNQHSQQLEKPPELERGTTERFSSKGFIVAAIGSAVGLGNMWKFPYITGENGGAAFFLVFIICLLLVGLPVLMAELTVGRGGRGSASGSLVRLSGKPFWGRFGFITIVGAFAILSFYSVVAGWTIHYAVLSFSGQLFHDADYAARFGEFIGGWWPVLWQAIVMLLTGFVVAKGIASGIERFNKILIPAMVVLLVVLMIRGVTLEGASEGVAFFLRPDFSSLTPQAFLIALGHAFFSLSLGMGTMLTYGAYVDRRQSLGAATFAIGLGDLLYALLAGLIIFPTTFAFGIAPDQGPGLLFVALPAAFDAMPLGSLFAGLFFVIVAIAAVTSAVSLLEVPVTYLIERKRWSRVKAATIVTISCLAVGFPSAVSVGGTLPGLEWQGKTFFDWVDFITSNIVLPVGGLVVTLFVGYAWKRAADEAGLAGWWLRIWLAALRYVAPILIVLIFLHSSGLLKL